MAMSPLSVYNRKKGAGMALPQSAAHRSLKQLVGLWRGTGEVLPNPWGPSGPTSGHWAFRLDRNGYNLLADFRETGENGYAFEAHGVMTVDPEAEEIVWFWFDSFGFPPLAPFRGRWNGGTLALEKTTPRGIGRQVIELGSEVLRFVVEAKAGDAASFAKVMQGSYAREPGSGV